MDGHTLSHHSRDVVERVGMITVKLILESVQNPNPLRAPSGQINDRDRRSGEGEEETANWNEENLLHLRVLNLNSKKISKIDNLELFHEIRELYLQDNRISLVENLEFLFQVPSLSSSPCPSLCWSSLRSVTDLRFKRQSD